jgi:NAD(P)-dependent dehydrogenase (short-subunit alcohol dehydrogenase family)
MRLAGKVAIVTGGANGMGAEEARLFAREGAAVVVADVMEGEGKQVEAEIVAVGGKAQFVRVDVTSEADWKNAIDAAVGGFGKLDILVNNAGLSSSSETDPFSTDGWQRIMEVNSTGVFLGTKHAVAAMRQTGGGSIVNISSILGFAGTEGGHPAYAASKGAVRIFTKQMAVNVGKHGIRVNSVHPGFMPPMRSGRPRNPAAMEEIIKQTPLRRTGETIEVAYAVLFLASDEASFITGTELVVDGGWLAR